MAVRPSFLLLLFLAVRSAALGIEANEVPQYVGRDKCAACHQHEFQLYTGSHHDLAMQPATVASVRGDFNNVTFSYAGITSRFFSKEGSFYVRTDGPDG